MTKNDPKSGPEAHEEPESLSATGLFLRAFDPKSGSAPESSSAVPGDSPVTPSHAAPSRTPAQSGTRGTEPGEFTRMFQKLDPRLDVNPSNLAQEVPAESRPMESGGPAKRPLDKEPGEFTRIFVAGSTPLPPPPAKPADEVKRATPPVASPSRAKGFSAPGVSDSASAEGSFTQFFKAVPSTPASKPAAPVTPSKPRETTSPPAEREMSFKNEPIFRAPEPSRSDPHASPSITNLMASLGAPDKASPGSSASEPVPYRPASLQSSSTPPRASERSGLDLGGVTRLIERLAEELPPSVPLPVEPIVTPVESGGPGEYTRMVSIPAINEGVAGQAGPPAAAKAASPAAPIFAPLPKPAMPAMPAMPAPAAPAPAMRVPPVKAPAIPPMPAPAPPAAPALSAPKTKLEAIVPILLVINTFLLIVILMVVVFALKSR